MLQHIKSKHADTFVCKEEYDDSKGEADGDVEQEDGMVKCQLCDFISSEAGLTEHIVKYHVICKME